MLSLHRLISCTFFSLILLTSSSAQTSQVMTQRVSALTITISVGPSNVRFTALGSVRQMRLEVFDARDSAVFDSGFLPGNVRDWSPQDGSRRSWRSIARTRECWMRGSAGS